LGIGLRYVGGDLERIAFIADLSFGYRWVTIRNANESFTMRSPELFRLGLGAEFRLSSTFAVTPLLTLSGGAMSHANGNITFNPGQSDGVQTPLYGDAPKSDSIDQETGYLVISLAVGGHFDLFAKY
jgi:hypothetical protein